MKKLFSCTAWIANVLSPVTQTEIGVRKSLISGFRRSDDTVISQLFISLIIATVLVFSSSASADCRSDCSDQYAAGVETCESIHHDPLDAGDLKMCIDNTREVFNTCIAGCIGPGGR